ncbi:phosphoribosyl-AMP cyclohydrolase [bacterium]|nr:phosphoribosyl-AMP cyclohydrolase [bacterium]
MKFINELKFNSDGLIPAIIQDAEDNTVLMMAYMNKDSLKATLETKKTNFWSRSRQKYWVKGESSGHTQDVKAVYYDCDADTLLIKVIQHGAACHMGYRSCFYTQVHNDGTTEIIAEKIFDPDKVYKK